MDQTAINLDTQIESKALALPEQAKLIIVTDNASMEQANNFKLDIKAMMKEIDEWFKPLADKAFQTHRAITGKWNDTKKPLQEADAHVTQQVKNYLAEIRRQQEAEEARLREIARKEEEERRLREAEALEAEGRKEEATEILDEPITYVTPTVRIETPKVDNRMYKTVLKGRVKDMKAFFQYVAARPEIYDLIAINDGNLNRRVKALGKAFSMPGVELYEV
jgi:hypothetical protein